MKNLMTKIKTYFKSININFNLILGILIVTGLIFVTIKVTNHLEKKKAFEIELQRIELLNKSLDISNTKKAKIKKAEVIIDELQEKIEENEKVDWDNLYSADADSIASEVADWNKRFYNRSKQNRK